MKSKSKSQEGLQGLLAYAKTNGGGHPDPGKRSFFSFQSRSVAVAVFLR